MIENYEYPFIEGDRVQHYRDINLVGCVQEIDRNLPHPTTCTILWDGYLEVDIHWSNKIIKLE